MKLIALLILFAASTFAQDESILKLFPGKWKINSDKAEFYEEWKMIDSTELVGKGYSIEAGEVLESETIYLKKFADTWAYVAIPKNQAITLFALNDFTQNKFIFENGEHDFPQRVIYEFASDSILNAKIEGVIEGELMSREFSFSKVDK
jgi:hypothetical protein